MSDDPKALNEVLSLMAKYGVTHMPWGAGTIVRPIPDSKDKKKSEPDEFERVSKMSPAEQDAYFKAIQERRPMR